MKNVFFGAVLCLVGVGMTNAAITATGVYSMDSSAYVGDTQSNDLVNRGQATLASTTANTANIFGIADSYVDGVAKGDDSTTVYLASDLSSYTTFTFNLNTTTNVDGYDISSIQTIAGWYVNGAGMANQKYELKVSYVGSSSFVSLGIFDYEPFTENSSDPNGAGSTKLTIANPGGMVASGVDAVQIAYLPVTYAGTYPTVVQEIDIVGTATVPEPMTMSLLGLGGLALLKRRKN